MTLGELIRRLKPCAPSVRVRFDFGNLVPIDLSSYRGYYEQLAIIFGEEDGLTVAAFLALLQAAVGATFTGYKGGDFKMTKDTEIWVSQHGDASGTRLSGVVDYEYEVVLETRYEP